MRLIEVGSCHCRDVHRNVRRAAYCALRPPGRIRGPAAGRYLVITADGGHAFHTEEGARAALPDLRAHHIHHVTIPVRNETH